MVPGERKKERSVLPGGTLGTFGGVFTPSILTILGIILFLRLGYVVGSAGLGPALLIIGLANAISVLTTFSLSAISTNLRVKGGGDYYLISRTLGVEFGGAIGIVLFLAQSVSVGFYCIGFAEAVSGMFSGGSEYLPQIIAAGAVCFLFIFAWLGADWATRFQYIIMVILAAALVSFFIGGIEKWDSALFVQNWGASGPGSDFWILFAIFFPAVTGFTQGVSMSGDLREPGKSLPLGTFLAVGLSILIYFGVAIVFSATAQNASLVRDYAAMKRVAWFDFLIDAGVIAATLSSAIASFLGAPRILQSMAKDRIFPFLIPFAKGYGPLGNPRRGVLLSAGIALATIALGSLNLIASVVSMFFLISYGLLNYATYFEARAASPSFRPRFRFYNLKLSLLGCLACLGAMLAIDLAAGIAALAVLLAIFQYLKRIAGPSRWADSTRAYHLQRVREHLFKAASEIEHPRDWRPLLLAFSDDPLRRKHLLQFSSWLEGGSGLTTIVQILEGAGVKMLKQKTKAEKDLVEEIAQYGIQAFPLVTIAQDFNTGIQNLVQSFGVGPLRANTILLNWIEQTPRGGRWLKEIRFGRNVRAAFRFGLNIVVLNAGEEEWAAMENVPLANRRIDLWWRGDATSRLMLLFAYLMTRSDEWNGVRIRVIAFKSENEPAGTEEDLSKMLEEVRIEAEPVVLSQGDRNSIVQESSGASVVFIPLRLQRYKPLDPFGGELEDLLKGIQIAALVLAAKDIELDAEPEEGKAGETAAALDTLADAEKKAREAEEKAAKAALSAEEKRKEMRKAAASGVSEEDLSRIETAALEAKMEADKAAKRAAKALAKLRDAAQEAKALGGISASKLDEAENSSKNP